ncbi:hypothetical protein A2U01_0105375, partial [Trifolium medium]|nr:hypothetical protein [Trifolium medium]
MIIVMKKRMNKLNVLGHEEAAGRSSILGSRTTSQ